MTWLVHRLAAQPMQGKPGMANERKQDDATTDRQCPRCFWLLNGRPDQEIPEHSPQCPFRHAGRDPRQSDLEQMSDRH